MKVKDANFCSVHSETRLILQSEDMTLLFIAPHQHDRYHNTTARLNTDVGNMVSSVLLVKA